MRYRRYYTQRNKDGSRTVISTGPALGCTYLIGKWFVVLVLVSLPLALQSVIHGRTGVVISWVLEAIWLVLLVGGWLTARQQQKAPSAPSQRRNP
jgi:uncharacterized membrane protein